MIFVMKKHRTAGIIAEYNPLHNGHIYHIQKTREITGCEVIVACMSGNFVQRGEPAIIDKWTRAAAAVKAGVNLVIELPSPFVLQSATQFGFNAVRLLSMAGADCLCFGSETNNLEELKDIASMSFNVDNFRENMKKGYSYPASYGFMADSYGPNDILAISYLKALQQFPQIEPFSIKRTSGYHDDSLEVENASAKAIRKALFEGHNISEHTPLADVLYDYPSPSWEKLYPFLRTVLLTTPRDELQEIFLMDEGIEKHLIKQAQQYDDFESFANAAITRRYTRSRIQRTLCHLLIHNRKTDMKDLPHLDRIRPLAYDDIGRQYMRQLQDEGIIVVNHFTQNIRQYREIEYRLAVLYGTMMDPVHHRQIIRKEITGPYEEKD